MIIDVCWDRMVAFLIDGTEMPISSLHKANGRETNDLGDAAAIAVDLDDGGIAIALLRHEGSERVLH